MQAGDGPQELFRCRSTAKAERGGQRAERGGVGIDRILRRVLEVRFLIRRWAQFVLDVYYSYNLSVKSSKRRRPLDGDQSSHRKVVDD